MNQELLDSRVRGNDEGAGACEQTRAEPDDSRAPAGPAPRDPRCGHAWANPYPACAVSPEP